MPLCLRVACVYAAFAASFTIPLHSPSLFIRYVVNSPYKHSAGALETTRDVGCIHLPVSVPVSAPCIRAPTSSSSLRTQTRGDIFGGGGWVVIVGGLSHCLLGDERSASPSRNACVHIFILINHVSYPSEWCGWAVLICDRVSIWCWH